MGRPLPYPKKINPREKLYYHFKINASTYVLFDSELDTPIAHGSYNFVGATISQLPANTTIFYYEVDKQLGWRMKMRYNSEKQTVDSNDAKKTVEKTEEKKKDLT